jgi:hypothetical protein
MIILYNKCTVYCIQVVLNTPNINILLNLFDTYKQLLATTAHAILYITARSCEKT